MQKSDDFHPAELASTIKFNYIETGYHLRVNIHLCSICLENLKKQLQNGTIIKLKLKLCLPDCYISQLILGNQSNFVGSCHCFVEESLLAKVPLMSFKGQIQPIRKLLEPIRKLLALDTYDCDTILHITNTQRRLLCLLYKIKST